jgi:SHOCT-like protein
MPEERKKVLEMLASGKITAEEAEKLLDKLTGAASSQTSDTQPAGASSAAGTAKPRFLRIVVDHPGKEQVNMRVPLAFVGTGTRLLAVMPQRVTDRLAEFGIDTQILSAANCEDLGQALREINIDVERGNGKKVRIYCE